MGAYKVRIVALVRSSGKLADAGPVRRLCCQAQCMLPYCLGRYKDPVDKLGLCFPRPPNSRPLVEPMQTSNGLLQGQHA